MPTISELASDVLAKLTAIANTGNNILQTLTATRQEIAQLRAELAVVRQAQTGVSSLILQAWVEPACYRAPHPAAEKLRIWALCQTANGAPISGPVNFNVRLLNFEASYPEKIEFDAQAIPDHGPGIYQINVHPTNSDNKWIENSTYGFVVDASLGGNVARAFASARATRLYSFNHYPLAPHIEALNGFTVGSESPVFLYATLKPTADPIWFTVAGTNMITPVGQAVKLLASSDLGQGLWQLKIVPENGPWVDRLTVAPVGVGTPDSPWNWSAVRLFKA
jgi:hypothetical protein